MAVVVARISKTRVGCGSAVGTPSVAPNGHADVSREGRRDGIGLTGVGPYRGIVWEPDLDALGTASHTASNDRGSLI